MMSFKTKESATIEFGQTLHDGLLRVSHRHISWKEKFDLLIADLAYPEGVFVVSKETYRNTVNKFPKAGDMWCDNSGEKIHFGVKGPVRKLEGGYEQDEMIFTFTIETPEVEVWKLKLADHHNKRSNTNAKTSSTDSAVNTSVPEIRSYMERKINSLHNRFGNRRI